MFEPTAGTLPAGGEFFVEKGKFRHLSDTTTHTPHPTFFFSFFYPLCNDNIAFKKKPNVIYGLSLFIYYYTPSFSNPFKYLFVFTEK